jgi:hypothetical protein
VEPVVRGSDRSVLLLDPVGGIRLVDHLRDHLMDHYHATLSRCVEVEYAGAPCATTSATVMDVVRTLLSPL